MNIFFSLLFPIIFLPWHDIASHAIYFVQNSIQVELPSLEKVEAAIGGPITIDAPLNIRGGSGAFTAIKFSDAANSAYFIEPAATGNSLILAGKVGIGTTAPGGKLEIANTGNRLTGLIVKGTEAGVVLRSTDTGGHDINLFAAGENSSVGAGGFAFFDNTANAYRLSVSSGGNVGIGIDNAGTAGLAVMNGNVGIGVTSPATKLHLSDSGVNSIIRLENQNVGVSAGTVYGAIEFNTLDTGHVGTAAKIEASAVGTNAQGRLKFSTGLPGSLVDTLFLEYDGKVGIGTTAPAKKLTVIQSADDNAGQFVLTNASQVAGAKAIRAASTAVAGTGYYLFDGATGTGADGSGGTSQFNVRGDGQGYFSGNVGIGTAAPETALHIRQATALGSALGNSQLASSLEMETGNNIFERTWLTRDAAGSDWLTSRVHNGISIDSAYEIPGTSTRTYWERDPYNNIQSWGTGAAAYLTINTGNVGIGTTAPGNILSVTEPNTIGDTLPALGANGSTFGVYSDGQKYGLIAGALTTGNVYMQVQRVDGTAASYNMLLQPNGGYVGIKTTSPTNVLVVGDDIGASAVPAQTVSIGKSNADSAIQIGQSSSVKGYLKWMYNATAANTYLSIGASGGGNVIVNQGKLGIGTTTPGYVLTVNGQPGANGYTAFTNYSDSRLKTNIKPLSEGYLQKLMELKPSTFNYNILSGYDEATRARLITGFIAQDLQKIFPEMVGKIAINGTEYLDSNLSAFPVYLLKGVQEQQKEIELLQQQMNFQQKQIDEQQKTIDDLSRQLNELKK